jgi:hypothetical protein
VAHIKGFSWRGITLSAPTTLLIVATGAGALGAGHYEQPPSFTAAQVLPANLQHGANYCKPCRPRQLPKHVQRAEQLGTFTIKGSDLLRVRLRESSATAKLQEIGGAETTVGAAARTALQPLSTAKDLVTAPGKTIGDTFRGSATSSAVPMRP